MIRIELKSTEEVEQLAKASVSQPDRYFVIFKHSTRCGTSRMALQLFESEWKLDKPVYFINVVESRAVSNAVAEIFGVWHESPQVIVIRNGKSIRNRSHSAIDAGEIMKLAASEPS